MTVTRLKNLALLHSHWVFPTSEEADRLPTPRATDVLLRFAPVSGKIRTWLGGDVLPDNVPNNYWLVRLQSDAPVTPEYLRWALHFPGAVDHLAAWSRDGLHVSYQILKDTPIQVPDKALQAAIVGYLAAEYKKVELWLNFTNKSLPGNYGELEKNLARGWRLRAQYASMARSVDDFNFAKKDEE